MLAGTIAYRLLWFYQWKNDEYYMHPMITCFAISAITFLCLLKNNYPTILFSRTAKFISVIFLLYNVWYAFNNIRMRFGISNDGLTARKSEINEWEWFNWNYHRVWEAFETIEPYNRSIGINKEDIVISIPDQTPCASLYFMNQRGWTNYYCDSLCTNKDTMQVKINKGAKYLFLNDSALLTTPAMQRYGKYKVGAYRNITVFDLRPFIKAN